MPWWNLASWLPTQAASLNFGSQRSSKMHPCASTQNCLCMCLSCSQLQALLYQFTRWDCYQATHRKTGFMRALTAELWSQSSVWCYCSTFFLQLFSCDMHIMSCTNYVVRQQSWTIMWSGAAAGCYLPVLSSRQCLPMLLHGKPEWHSCTCLSYYV